MPKVCFQVNLKFSWKDLVRRRFPWLAVPLHNFRLLQRQLIQNAIRRGIKWSMQSKEKRALLFSCLPEGLAITNNYKENYVVQSCDKVIGRSLFAKGTFDFQKFSRAIALIDSNSMDRKQTTLIDVGANIGSICIPAITRGCVQKAIAFEIDRDNIKLLKINALLNNVSDQIEIRNEALGETSKQISVRRNSTNSGDHRVEEYQNNKHCNPIQMVTLDSILTDAEIERSIIWMDVQGYEARVFQGAQRVISKTPPLITEFSPSELSAYQSLDLFISMIMESLYDTYWDLNELPESMPTVLTKSNLLELARFLEESGSFTDLLFLNLNNKNSGFPNSQ